MGSWCLALPDLLLAWEGWLGLLGAQVLNIAGSVINATSEASGKRDVLVYEFALSMALPLVSSHWTIDKQTRGRFDLCLANTDWCWQAHVLCMKCKACTNVQSHAGVM